MWYKQLPWTIVIKWTKAPNVISSLWVTSISSFWENAYFLTKTSSLKHLIIYFHTHTYLHIFSVFIYYEYFAIAEKQNQALNTKH